MELNTLVSPNGLLRTSELVRRKEIGQIIGQTAALETEVTIYADKLQRN